MFEMMKLGLSQIHHNFVKSEFLGTRWYILVVSRPLLQLRTAHFWKNSVNTELFWLF